MKSRITLLMTVLITLGMASLMGCSGLYSLVARPDRPPLPESLENTGIVFFHVPESPWVAGTVIINGREHGSLDRRMFALSLKPGKYTLDSLRTYGSSYSGVTATVTTYNFLNLNREFEIRANEVTCLGSMFIEKASPGDAKESKYRVLTFADTTLAREYLARVKPSLAGSLAESQYRMAEYDRYGDEKFLRGVRKYLANRLAAQVEKSKEKVTKRYVTGELGVILELKGTAVKKIHYMPTMDRLDFIGESGKTGYFLSSLGQLSALKEDGRMRPLSSPGNFWPRNGRLLGGRLMALASAEGDLALSKDEGANWQVVDTPLSRTRDVSTYFFEVGDLLLFGPDSFSSFSPVEERAGYLIDGEGRARKIDWIDGIQFDSVFHRYGQTIVKRTHYAGYSEFYALSIDTGAWETRKPPAKGCRMSYGREGISAASCKDGNSYVSTDAGVSWQKGP